MKNSRSMSAGNRANDRMPIPLKLKKSLAFAVSRAQFPCIMSCITLCRRIRWHCTSGGTCVCESLCGNTTTLSLGRGIERAPFRFVVCGPQPEIPEKLAPSAAFIECDCSFLVRISYTQRSMRIYRPFQNPVFHDLISRGPSTNQSPWSRPGQFKLAPAIPFHPKSQLRKRNPEIIHGRTQDGISSPMVSK